MFLKTSFMLFPFVREKKEKFFVKMKGRERKLIAISLSLIMQFELNT